MTREQSLAVSILRDGLTGRVEVVLCSEPRTCGNVDFQFGAYGVTCFFEEGIEFDYVDHLTGPTGEEFDAWQWTDDTGEPIEHSPDCQLSHEEQGQLARLVETVVRQARRGAVGERADGTC